MAMKFDRAYCVELKDGVTPYKAREIYLGEGDEFFGRQLTFRCEDPRSRSQLTAVGVYMPRKSKRALHFRSKEEHEAACGFIGSGTSRLKGNLPPENEDEFKPTNFPPELVLDPLITFPLCADIAACTARSRLTIGIGSQISYGRTRQSFGTSCT